MIASPVVPYNIFHECRDGARRPERLSHREFASVEIKRCSCEVGFCRCQEILLRDQKL